MINAIDDKDQWLLKRWGNFTASEIWKLLGKGKDGTGFSQTGKTYIEQKAIECLTDMQERPEMDEVESLLHGKAHELPAFNMYVKVSKNFNMVYMGTENPIYIPYNYFSGGTPDAVNELGGKIELIGEIKCPKNSGNHYRYLKFKTQWDLLEKRPEYYAQIQMLQMAARCKEGHFISYDDRFKDDRLKMKILEVPADYKFQDNLELRIMAAQKEKLRIIEELNNV